LNGRGCEKRKGKTGVPLWLKGRWGVLPTVMTGGQEARPRKGKQWLLKFETLGCWGSKKRKPWNNKGGEGEGNLTPRVVWMKSILKKSQTFKAVLGAGKRILWSQE